MPYRNIVFVKLEKRLLNDHRWYLMTPNAQLIYIKVILLAAETYNKIPKNDDVLRMALRIDLELSEFQKCIAEIKQNFSKFKENKHFRYFQEFDSKTNFRSKKDFLSNSPALPKCRVEEEEDKDQDKEKKKTLASLCNDDFAKNIRKTYDHVDIDFEFKKMDIWLSARPGRKKTRRFVINWLNKIERPMKRSDPYEGMKKL